MTSKRPHKRRFPINFERHPKLAGIRSIPWDLIEPRAQAVQVVHGATLDELVERGGLDPLQLLGALTDTAPADMAGYDPQRALSRIGEMVGAPWKKGASTP